MLARVTLGLLAAMCLVAVIQAGYTDRFQEELEKNKVDGGWWKNDGEEWVHYFFSPTSTEDRVNSNDGWWSVDAGWWRKDADGEVFEHWYIGGPTRDGLYELKDKHPVEPKQKGWWAAPGGFWKRRSDDAWVHQSVGGPVRCEKLPLPYAVREEKPVDFAAWGVVHGGYFGGPIDKKTGEANPAWHRCDFATNNTVLNGWADINNGWFRATAGYTLDTQEDGSYSWNRAFVGVPINFFHAGVEANEPAEPAIQRKYGYWYADATWFSTNGRDYVKLKARRPLPAKPTEYKKEYKSEYGKKEYNTKEYAKEYNKEYSKEYKPTSYEYKKEYEQAEYAKEYTKKEYN